MGFGFAPNSDCLPRRICAPASTATRPSMLDRALDLGASACHYVICNGDAKTELNAAMFIIQRPYVVLELHRHRRLQEKN